MKYVLSLVLLFIGFAQKTVAENDIVPVKAELLVDPVQQEADSTLIGVRFKIDPEWHLYWRYPGDTGLATQIKFSLPPGSYASEIMWPTPVKFMQAGGLVGYGYENEVILLSNVRIPASERGKDITIEARWIGCSMKLCVPGRATFKIKGSELGKSDNSKTQDLTSWRAKLPSSLTADVAAVEVHKSEGSSVRRSFEVVYDWKAAPGNLEWFPDLGRSHKIFNTIIKTEGVKSTVTFELEKLASASANINEIYIEIVKGEAGNRQGYFHKIATE